jgi:hypothetical protein
MKEMIRSHPHELGRLFVQNNEAYKSESLFESAVRKFGFARALRVLDECLPKCINSVPLFVLAASGGVGDVPLGVIYHVIYHLARRNVDGIMRS